MKMPNNRLKKLESRFSQGGKILALNVDHCDGKGLYYSEEMMKTMERQGWKVFIMGLPYCEHLQMERFIEKLNVDQVTEYLNQIREFGEDSSEVKNYMRGYK